MTTLETVPGRGLEPLEIDLTNPMETLRRIKSNFERGYQGCPPSIHDNQDTERRFLRIMEDLRKAEKTIGELSGNDRALKIIFEDMLARTGDMLLLLEREKENQGYKPSSKYRPAEKL